MILCVCKNISDKIILQNYCINKSCLSKKDIKKLITEYDLGTQCGKCLVYIKQSYNIIHN